MSTGDKRVCLITGAGGLLGNAFCQRYAGDYEIIAVCRSRAPGVPSQLERYVDPLAPDADLPENAASVYTIVGDLNSPHDVERIVEVALARFGKVDLLVNNAAYTARYHPTMVDDESALANLEEHLRTNVVAPFRLTMRLAQLFWRHRAEENRAANRNVVNVSSTAGLHVYPHTGQGGYATSKSALNTLTGHMAAEFDQFGVRANALLPNTFPDIVTTESVVEAIVRLDNETATGAALVLDAAT